MEKSIYTILTVGRWESLNHMDYKLSSLRPIHGLLAWKFLKWVIKQPGLEPNHLTHILGELHSRACLDNMEFVKSYLTKNRATERHVRMPLTNWRKKVGMTTLTISVTESKTTSTSGAARASFVVEDSQTSVYCLEAEAPKNVMENGVSETSEEQLYQISPYKALDDEDEEDDDANIQNYKFVPSGPGV